MNKKVNNKLQEDSKITDQIIKKEDKKESRISQWKDISAIIQSIFMVLGILGALYWFYEQGDVRPRAIVSQEVTHQQIDEKITWVHVSVKIRNIGKIPIVIKSGYVWIQKIKPIQQDSNKNIVCDKNSCVVVWPPACADYKHNLNNKLTIEPGEIDRKSYEFIIPHNIEIVKIYSYFDNPLKSWKFWKKKDPFGWDEVTIHDLRQKVVL